MHDAEKSIANIETRQDAPALLRRYWWLKRIAVGYVFFVGVVGVLYGAASLIAERRLGVELDKLRARGEPATLNDLAGAPVPPEQNAAMVLKKAAELDEFDSPDADALSEISLRPPLSAQNVETLERIVAKCEPGLQLVRRARDLPGVNWGLNTSNWSEMLDMRHENRHYYLYERVAAAAALAHAKQDDSACIEYFRDLLMLSRAIDRSPLLISHLHVIGIRGQTIGMIDAVVPRLQIARQEGAASNRPGAANPAQVRSLIGDLVDEDFHQGLARAMQGERVWNLAAFPEWWGNERWKTWPARPLLLTEARASLGWSSQYIEAARERNWPAARAKLPPASPVSLRPSLKLAAITAPGHLRTFRQHYRNLAAGRATAIALAHRLYRFDHGRPARRWDDLVPGYLPGIPADPLTGNAAMPFSPTTQPAGGK